MVKGRQSLEQIPKEIALQLSETIRQENSGRWYTFGGLMCWGCRRFSGGDPGRQAALSVADLAIAR